MIIFIHQQNGYLDDDEEKVKKCRNHGDDIVQIMVIYLKFDYIRLPKKN